MNNETKFIMNYRSSRCIRHFMLNTFLSGFLFLQGNYRESHKEERRKTNVSRLGINLQGAIQ